MGASPPQVDYNRPLPSGRKKWTVIQVSITDVHIILRLRPSCGWKGNPDLFFLLHLKLCISVVGQPPTNNIEVNQLKRSGINLAFRNITATCSVFYKRRFKKNNFAFLVPTLCERINTETWPGRLPPRSEDRARKHFFCSWRPQEKAQDWALGKSAPLGSCTLLWEGSHHWPWPGIWACISNKKKGKHRGWVPWQALEIRVPTPLGDSG